MKRGSTLGDMIFVFEGNLRPVEEACSIVFDESEGAERTRAISPWSRCRGISVRNALPKKSR